MGCISFNLFQHRSGNPNRVGIIPVSAAPRVGSQQQADVTSDVNGVSDPS